MRFYKYTESKYLDSMLQGTIRIGTLYEYREYENIEIRDEEEGTAFSFNYIKEETINDNKLPNAMGRAFKLIDCEEITFINCSSYIKTEVSNAYIYCLTKTPSRSVMEHFGYDACIEIVDIKKFAICIAEELWKLKLTTGLGCAVHDCFYENTREVNLDDPKYGLKIYWLKDKRFRNQDEYRLVFDPICKNNTLKYEVKYIPGITEYFREVNL